MSSMTTNNNDNNNDTSTSLSIRYQAEQAACCNPWARKRLKMSDVSTASTPATNNINNNINNSNIDIDLARDMHELSFEEREHVYEDIHGVAKIPDETTDFVKERIQAFDRSIQAIPVLKRNAFQRALFLWPDLKTDNDFKLLFLRADRFDAPKAAQRMVQYYEQKRMLFGEELLVKRITMEDLCEKDIKVFKLGFMVVLPVKDRSGRSVFFYDVAKIDWGRVSVENILRCFWYKTMSAMEDECNQRKGACMITHVFGTSLKPGFVQNFTNLTLRCGQLIRSAIPAHFACMHFGFSDPTMDFLLAPVRISVGKTLRVRLRTYKGSDVESEYSLITFGLPCEELLQRARRGDTTIHEQYILRRMQIDKQKDQEELELALESGYVPYPSPSDVLIGRGRPYREFPGNEPWNELIQSHVENYRQATSRFAKTCVAMRVLHKIRELKEVRFLLEPVAAAAVGGGGWKVLDDKRAREKVAAALQNRLKALIRAETCK